MYELHGILSKLPHVLLAVANLQNARVALLREILCMKNSSTNSAKRVGATKHEVTSAATSINRSKSAPSQTTQKHQQHLHHHRQPTNISTTTTTDNPETSPPPRATQPTSAKELTVDADASFPKRFDIRPSGNGKSAVARMICR